MSFLAISPLPLTAYELGHLLGVAVRAVGVAALLRLVLRRFSQRTA